MSRFEVRVERPADVGDVRRVHLEAFPSEAEARLVDALREAGNLTLSLCATVADEVIGHVAFSPVTCEGEWAGWGLAPVATLAAHRRQGVADALIRAGLERARSGAIPLVVVLGEPAYYQRFGFVSARPLGLADEYEGGDAFQALELPSEVPRVRGLVRYAPEFSAVDS